MNDESKSQSEPVGYRQRFICPEEGPSCWVLTESNIFVGRPGWEVVPLYTYTDPAEIESLKSDKQAFAQNAVDLRVEVERLRAELVEWKERCQRNSDEAMNWMAKYDTLRAQLAERGSLLEEALGSVYVDAGCCESEAEHSDLIELSERIKANLSASAEPSFENKGIKNHDGRCKAAEQKLLVQHILDNDKGLSDSSRVILEKLIEG